MKNRPFESIEKLLERTLLDPSSSAGGSAHQRFKFAINRVFCLIGSKLNWCCLDKFLRKQFELPEAQHTFISFNYDLVLDRAIQKQGGSAWEVSSGYGFPIPYYVQEDLPKTAAGAGPLDYVPALQFPSPTAPPGRLRALKPHGSLNWLVPFKLPYEPTKVGIATEDAPVVIPLTASGALRYWCSTLDSQHVQCPGKDPHEVGVCILPPSSAKRSGLSFLESIRHQEIQALRDADEIYVLGWSMPETDTDQECLIRSAVRDRRESIGQVTAVSRGASPEYFRR
ncbi:MAG: hypothetical protein AAB393_04340, partial [Bacteroidota bacterium]